MKLKLNPRRPNPRRRPIGKETAARLAACSFPRFPDLRRDDVARLGEGGEGIARTWLVTFINGEVLRRYQEPVALDRVLSEHHAALAAVPVEG